VRFGVVGVVATAVHYLSLRLLVEQMFFSPSTANGVAFLCAICVTYIGQHMWVFQRSGRLSLTLIVRFSLSLSFGFFANMAIMAASVNTFDLTYQSGFLLALVFVPALSFIINKFWVFRSL
jgi:putative flippase GtrA